MNVAGLNEDSLLVPEFSQLETSSTGQVHQVYTRTSSIRRRRILHSFDSKLKVDLRVSHTRIIISPLGASLPSNPLSPVETLTALGNMYRASRQRLLIAGKNLSMLCVPEGGMNLDWDLTYIIDGMTTVEHALPVPTLYEDVMTLYALSGTGSTPTHLVNYGGVMGEQ